MTLLWLHLILTAQPMHCKFSAFVFFKTLQKPEEGGEVIRVFLNDFPSLDWKPISPIIVQFYCYEKATNYTDAGLNFQ